MRPAKDSALAVSLAVGLGLGLGGCASEPAAGGDDADASAVTSQSTESSVQPGWPTVEVLAELDLAGPVAPDAPTFDEPLDVAYAQRYADYLAEEMTYALRTSIADPELRNSWCQACSQLVTLADQLRDDRQLIRTEPVRAKLVGVSDEQVRHIRPTGPTVWIDVDLVLPAMQLVDEEGVVQDEAPPGRFGTRLEVAVVGVHTRAWWTITDEAGQPPTGQA